MSQRMICRMVAVALPIACATALLAGPPDLTRVDELFAGRDEVEQLRQGVADLERLLSQAPADYEVLWRLARLYYYLGEREEDERNMLLRFDAGIEAAKRAVELAPQRVEGHFWLGANRGRSADRRGALAGLGSIKTIRREFETALRLDAGYENSSAYVGLGEMDLRLPWLLGGNRRRGLATLEKGLAAAPDNVELRIRLARHYLESGRKDEARSLLETALSIRDPLRTRSEMERLLAEARSLLATAK